MVKETESFSKRCSTSAHLASKKARVVVKAAKEAAAGREEDEQARVTHGHGVAGDCRAHA